MPSCQEDNDCAGRVSQYGTVEKCLKYWKKCEGERCKISKCAGGTYVCCDEDLKEEFVCTRWSEELVGNCRRSTYRIKCLDPDASFICTSKGWVREGGTQTPGPQISPI